MLNKVVLTAAAAAAMFGFANEARAEWADTGAVTATCGDGTSGPAMTIGFENIGDHPYTGEIGYVRARVVGGCDFPDSIGLEFMFPDGMIPNVTAATPVRCVQGYGNPTTYDPISVTCNNTWTTGPHGGKVYGRGRILKGQVLEYRIPVWFTKREPGVMSVWLDNSFDTMDRENTAYPIITYRADFTNYTASSSADGATANVSFKLSHYHEAGTLQIEYGTQNFEHLKLVGVTDPAATWHDGVTAALTGVTPGTTVYWRPRLELPDGGFYWGPTGTLVMNPASIGPPRCRRLRC